MFVLTKIVMFAAALAVAVAVAGWLTLERGRDPGTVVLAGTVEAHEVRLGSLASGRVSEVLADEGDHVRQGQPLVTLSTTFLDIELHSQLANVEKARAELELARAGPRSETRARAFIEWQEAEKVRERERSLLQQRLISDAQYSQSTARAGALREFLNELEGGSRIEEIRIAEASVAEQEARLAYLRAMREEAVVTASVDGVVSVLRVRPGSLVAASEPLATLTEDRGLWVATFIPETELGLVTVGQAVDVQVDSFPGVQFPGRVRHVSSQGQYTPRNVQTLEQRSQLMFEVRVDLADHGKLKPGMAALVSAREQDR